MAKTIFHFFSLLLLPCLLTDPVTASALISCSVAPAMRNPAFSPFYEQALSHVVLASLHPRQLLRKVRSFSSIGNAEESPFSASSHTPPEMTWNQVRDQKIRDIVSTLEQLQTDSSSRYLPLKTTAALFARVLPQAPPFADRLATRYVELSDRFHLNPGAVWVVLRASALERHSLTTGSRLEIDFVVEHPNQSIQSRHNALQQADFDAFSTEILNAVETLSRELGIHFSTRSFPFRIIGYGDARPSHGIPNPTHAVILATVHETTRLTLAASATPAVHTSDSSREAILPAEDISQRTSFLYHLTSMAHLREIVRSGGFLDPLCAVDKLLYFSPVPLLYYGQSKFGAEAVQLEFDTLLLREIRFYTEYTTRHRVPLASLTSRSIQEIALLLGPDFHDDLVNMLGNLMPSPSTPNEPSQRAEGPAIDPSQSRSRIRHFPGIRGHQRHRAEQSLFTDSPGGPMRSGRRHDRIPSHGLEIDHPLSFRLYTGLKPAERTDHRLMSLLNGYWTEQELEPWGDQSELGWRYDALIGYAKGEPVGAYGYRWHTSSGRVEGNGIYVDQAHREQGIGSALREKLISYLKTIKSTDFYIQTPDPTAAAIGFNEALEGLPSVSILRLAGKIVATRISLSDYRPSVSLARAA